MDQLKQHQSVAMMGGSSALPRRSGELVFHDDWERRAFAMAVALCEQGHYPWETFRDQLIAEINATGDIEQQMSPQAPGYYEHWLASLEKVLTQCGLLDLAESNVQS